MAVGALAGPAGWAPRSCRPARTGSRLQSCTPRVLLPGHATELGVGLRAAGWWPCATSSGGGGFAGNRRALCSVGANICGTTPLGARRANFSRCDGGSVFSACLSCDSKLQWNKSLDMWYTLARKRRKRDAGIYLASSSSEHEPPSAPPYMRPPRLAARSVP